MNSTLARQCLFVFVTIVVYVISTSELATAIDLPELPFKGTSFALTTSMSGLDEREGSFKYTITEAYSEAQGRSKIDYVTIWETDWQKSKKIPKSGTFYIDSDKFLLVDRDKRTCSVSSRQVATTLFSLDAIERDTTESKTAMPISGPARLLFFLDRHRNEMTKSNLTDLEVRNIPCVMYKLEVSDIRVGIVRFEIYYKASKTTPAGSSRAQIPLQLAMEAGDISVIYDFLSAENLNGAQVETYQSYGAQFDRFAIEPGLGCGQHLEEEHGHQLDLDKVDLMSFSFTAEVDKPKTREKMDLVVAYESSTCALRVDKHSAITLTNYYLGLTYHILDTQKEFSPSAQRMIEDIRQEQDKQLACVVVENMPFNQKVPFNLGELLLGATKFMYLGRAKVRGLEVSAYEAYDSKWPIWFRQPMVFHRGNLGQMNDIRLVRPTNQGLDSTLSTVVYVISEPDGKEKNPNSIGHIVQIDICTMGNHNVCSPEATISVFDFSWQVNVHSATGLSAENYFSLVDLCPAAEVDDNHYGRVDMLSVANFKSQSMFDETLTWLYNIAERNFAYLDVIQKKLSLPTSMVYDLETTISLGHSSSTGLPIKMAASFRVAEHEHRMAKLTFLGMGNAKEEYSRPMDLQGSHLTFQGCVFVAAHRKVQTYFAYDPKTGKCLLDARGGGGGSPSASVSYAPMAFEIQVGAKMEIYRVTHEEPKWLASYDRLTRLSRGPERLNFLNDREKSTFTMRGVDANIEFQLKSLDVSELNQKSSYQLDDQHLPDTNKFPGLGLLVSDQWNRRVLADPLSSNNWQINRRQQVEAEDLKSDMTFGQCRSACLQDFQCNSFSVCIRGHQLECILSSVTFRDPMLVLQIIQSKQDAERAPSGNLTTTFQVNVDETKQINLRRHPNCELHNKIYLDLFIESARSSQISQHRRFHPVSGREECAQMCVNHTLTLLRRDVLNQQQVVSDSSESPRSDQDKIDDHRSLFSNICKAFMYLDKSKLASLDKQLQDVIKSQVENAPVDGYADGFCVIGEEVSASESEAIGEQTNWETDKQVALQRYLFKFESFYERQTGVRLRESPEAHSLARENWLNSKNYLSSNEQLLIRPYTQRGFNSQVFTYKDVQACSLMCFTQSVGLSPACKSFDIIIKRAYKQVTICQLNTMSLGEAINGERFDLIEDKMDDDTQVWHYDPLPGFVTAEVEQQARLWFVHFNWHSSSGARLGALTVVCLVVVGLLAGTVLGVTLGSRYLVHATGGRQEDEQTSELVDNTRTVEFSNLVNFEGRISIEE